MPIEVKLPNLGEGIDTGDVLELLVKEGDIVAKDQGIIELETGKATLQVPSSAAGKVAKVHVSPGQSIPPGTLLLTLEAAAPHQPEAQARVPAPSTTAPQPQPVQKKQAAQAPAAAPPKAASAAEPPPKHESAPVPPEPVQSPKSQIPNPKSAASSSPQPSASLPESTHNGGGVAAGPAVRRFA